MSQCNNCWQVTDLQKVWVWKGPLDITQLKSSAQTRIGWTRLLRALDISKDGGFTTTTGNLLHCLIILTLGKTRNQTTWSEFSEFQFAPNIFCPVAGHHCEERHWASLFHLHKFLLLPSVCSHGWDSPECFLFQADQSQLSWPLLTCRTLRALN